MQRLRLMTCTISSRGISRRVHLVLRWHVPPVGEHQCRPTLTVEGGDEDERWWTGQVLGMLLHKAGQLIKRTRTTSMYSNSSCGRSHKCSMFEILPRSSNTRNRNNTSESRCIFAGLPNVSGLSQHLTGGFESIYTYHKHLKVLICPPNGEKARVMYT